MFPTMITEIAEASSQLIHLVDDLLHQTQTRRLDAATAQASDDVQNFKDDLLARRLESVNLRLAGLQHGILVHLTDAESEQLRAVSPNLDACALLGLYARARAADLAAECGEILRATASTTTGSAG
jgi:light-regulated signal transduction histidine kinase (bacteriophytochrome)